MTCFGPQNVHGGDACHSPAEAFKSLWPSLQPVFFCCSNHGSRYLDRDATKSEHADGVHSLKLHLLSTSLGVKHCQMEYSYVHGLSCLQSRHLFLMYVNQHLTVCGSCYEEK